MNFINFARYIRKQTGTNSATFLDTDILLYANIYKDELSRRIVRTKQDVFGMPMTVNLALNGDGTPQREYPLDSQSFQQVKHVEAQFDGINWVPLDEMDLIGYNGATDEATISSSFGVTKGTAKYDLFRGSLWLYSGTFGAVTNGLKLWTFQWPNDFTDLTLSNDMSVDPSNPAAGLPRQFHELLARRIIIAKKSEGDKPLQLTDNEKKYDVDLATALDEFSDNSPLQADIPQESQWDNGFNL